MRGIAGMDDSVGSEGREWNWERTGDAAAGSRLGP